MNHKLHNIQFTDPIHYYHVGNAIFDKPCIKTINNVREQRNTHDNSVLGFWISTYPSFCANLGPYTYKLSIKPNTTNKGITLEDFYNLCTKGNNGKPLTLLQYNELRLQWMSICDVIYILDRTQYINEVIVLNFDCIDTFTLIDNIPPNKSYPLQRVT